MNLSDGTSSYFYDIAFNNKVLLEINGDFWHANPEQYKATDILKYTLFILKIYQQE